MRLTRVFRLISALIRLLLPFFPKVVVDTMGRLSCEEGRSISLIRRRLRRRTILPILMRCRLRINSRQGRAIRPIYLYSRCRLINIFAYANEERNNVGGGKGRPMRNYVVARARNN